MKLPIREALAIVQSVSEPHRAWADVVSLCQSTVPSVPFDTLPKLDLESDITAATRWLEIELHNMPSVRGLYLGLDTLNMDEGHGTNLEIGGSSTCDPLAEGIDWVYKRNLTYGSKHLIRGLFTLKQVYETDEWAKAARLCDYVFFLSYSGIVLAESFSRLDTTRTIKPVWGFHDGDLFALGLKNKGAFTRICK